MSARIPFALGLIAVNMHLYRAGDIQVHHRYVACWSRLIHRPGRRCWVDQKCSFFFTFVLLTYSYTALVIYSYPKDHFALLTVGDTPASSTRLCRPEVASLRVQIAVNLQLSRLIYRPGRHNCVTQKRFGLSSQLQ